MVSATKSTDFFQNRRSIVNRAAGFLLLLFFTPIILIVAGAQMARTGSTQVFVTVYPANKQSGYEENETGLWRFRVDDDDTAVGQFLKYSRLNLLPQFANVARGDIPVSRALQ